MRAIWHTTDIERTYMVDPAFLIIYIWCLVFIKFTLSYFHSSGLFASSLYLYSDSTIYIQSLLLILTHTAFVSDSLQKVMLFEATFEFQNRLFLEVPQPLIPCYRSSQLYH